MKTIITIMFLLFGCAESEFEKGMKVLDREAPEWLYESPKVEIRKDLTTISCHDLMLTAIRGYSI